MYYSASGVLDTVTSRRTLVIASSAQVLDMVYRTSATPCGDVKGGCECCNWKPWICSKVKIKFTYF